MPTTPINPVIYNVNFALQIEQLLPPSKRTTKTLAYMGVFGRSFQYQRDLLFDTYANGFGGAIWAAGTYTKGQRVRYIDHSVYEVQVASTTTTPSTSTDWLKIQDVWIGVRERTRYTGNKIVLIYGLNRWFDTVFRQPNGTLENPVTNAAGTSDIYIVNNSILVNQFKIPKSAFNTSSFIPNNGIYGIDGIPNVAFALNQYAFTIFVPLAVFNALAANNTDRENVVRAFADKYVIAGIIYKVQTY